MKDDYGGEEYRGLGPCVVEGCGKPIASHSLHPDSKPPYVTHGFIGATQPEPRNAFPNTWEILVVLRGETPSRDISNRRMVSAGQGRYTFTEDSEYSVSDAIGLEAKTAAIAVIRKRRELDGDTQDL